MGIQHIKQFQLNTLRFSPDVALLYHLEMFHYSQMQSRKRLILKSYLIDSATSFIKQNNDTLSNTVTAHNFFFGAKTEKNHIVFI